MPLMSNDVFAARMLACGDERSHDVGVFQYHAGIIKNVRTHVLLGNGCLLVHFSASLILL